MHCSKPKARDPPLPWMIEVKTPEDIAGTCPSFISLPITNH